MPSRLQNLYQYLIVNRRHEINGWHDSYKEFCEQVQEIRRKIKDEQYKLSSLQDEAFLKRLLYDKSNGIASRGQSVLSWPDFQKFIGNKDFLDALEKLIVNPSSDTLADFERVWLDQRGSNNPVLINRVAAACTTEVSSTVDSGKFNQLFYWLTKEKIIEQYDGNDDWFSKNKFLMDSLKKKIYDGVINQNTEDDEYYLSQFVWILYENMLNPFSLKKQIIKYGAPGTGKTYQARVQTSLLFDIWKEEFAPTEEFNYDDHIEFVQFHPSFSYEDFMEGLRPEPSENGAKLILQNGIFKDFCRKAGKWELDVYSFLPKTVKKDWIDLTIEDLLPYRKELLEKHKKDWEYIFNNSDTSKKVSDAVPPFFFVIDEINRAELSRVLGELMFCLEYRGVKGRVKTQYAKLNDEKTGMIKIGDGYQFFIPNNVYLIGTMNTIDRSVESFDFALRRRFRWEEVMPDTGLLKYHLNSYHKEWVPLADNLEELNKCIKNEPLLGPDYQIGHCYLMNLKYSKELTATDVRLNIWEDSIKPLLQEYLRGTGKEIDLMHAFEKAFGL